MPSRLSNLFSIIVILSSCTITLTVVASEPFQFQFQSRHQCNDDETRAHPHHCHLMELAATTPKEFATDFHNWAKHIGFVVDQGTSTSAKHPELEPDGTAVKTVKRNLRDAGGVGKKKRGARSVTSTGSRPTVFAHGMGDSCFNGGMEWVTQRTSNITGQYSTCIPTGDNLHDDTLNGYFLSMNANVDVFAEKIQKDPSLAGGFDAIGFSQGNNVIRGYIARYNDPPVNTFISINGVNAGIGAVPYCIPKFEVPVDPNSDHKSSSLNAHVNVDVDVEGKICNALMEIASHRAYSEFSQTHSFQANYWRDPRPEEKENYKKYSQLAQISNSGMVTNATLNENYAKTQQFVWILATKDTIVWPREGEQWGAPNSHADDPFDADILPMKETEWYKSDLFGLKTADELGRNYFEHFVGNHLEFSWDQFDSWVTKYLLA